MTDVSGVILRAIREAQTEGDQPTRLATVTGGSALTLQVKFDGESVASTRNYPRTLAVAAVGDRVVMLRSGGTWLPIARVPSTSADANDTGWVAVSLLNGWANFGAPWATAAYRRVDGACYLKGLILQPTAGSVGLPICVLPVDVRPVEHMMFSAMTALGSIRLDVQSNGVVIYASGNAPAANYCSIQAAWS